MTEVVTSFAASQLNLLAHRQQDFSVERSPAQDSGVQAVSQDTQAIGKQERAVAANTSDEQATKERQHQERRQSQDEAERSAPTGPAKPRIELKSINFGLTPAEVVGTVDVLQRFDDNGDGRVDLIESQQTQVSREGDSTFEGLAAAPATSGLRSTAPDQKEAGSAAEPVVATAGQQQTPGQPVEEEAGVDVGKKYFGTEDIASLGSPTDTEDAPRKFYGQGAEVVIGQFAAATEAAPKYSEKAPTDARSEGAVTEEGTGEVKYYDKVAQSDADQSFGEPSGEEAGSLYEKAQQIASALEGDDNEPEQKKYVQTEAPAYSSTGEIAANRHQTIPGATVITV